MPIKEGPEIWVETVLTAGEWKDNLKKYPNTCNVKEPRQFFKSDYEWRWRMGGKLTSDEIRLINKRFDEWLKTVRNDKSSKATLDD
jgi:hypothetical protein